MTNFMQALIKQGMMNSTTVVRYKLNDKGKLECVSQATLMAEDGVSSKEDREMNMPYKSASSKKCGTCYWEHTMTMTYPCSVCLHNPDLEDKWKKKRDIRWG